MTISGIMNPSGGLGISANAITNELETLYSMVKITKDTSFTVATPQLMAQVVLQESSDMQFKQETLYGINSFWPNESPPETNSKAGAHIGLTQVPTTEVDAWNWLQNSTDGVLNGANSIQTKLATAYSLASTYLYKDYNGISPLTSCQLEEMGLALYGPSGEKKSSQQYYTAQCIGGTKSGTKCNGGSWQWELNEASPKEICAVCYVAEVRSKVPTGSTSSSCPATAEIPADPPTVASLGGCGGC